MAKVVVVETLIEVVVAEEVISLAATTRTNQRPSWKIVCSISHSKTSI